MRRLAIPTLVLLALILVLPSHAAAVEYGTQSGWGRMLLDHGKQRVSIHTVIVNGHSCTVHGRLTGAALDRAETEQGCRFQLQRKAQGALAVVIDDAAHDACRANCGARASFDGDYLPLPAACTQAGLARRQREALQAYRGKHYDAAFQLWSGGLSNCEPTMAWPAVWAWRNDAAISAAHAGRTADCQRLSQAVLADVKGVTLPGETEPFTFAPSDAYTAQPLIAAARHNLAQCNASR